MRRFGIAAGLALAAVPTPGPTADWSISGALSQRIEFDPSPNSEKSVSLGSVTGLNLVIEGVNPTTRVFFAPGVSFSYFTDADSNLDTVNDLSPSFSGGVSHAGGRWTVGGDLSVVPRQSSFARFEDDEFDDDFIDDDVEIGDAVQIDINGGLNVGYALTPLDSLSFGLSGRTRQYTEEVEELPSTYSYGGSLSWGRALNPRTSLSLGGSYTRFIAEGRDATDSVSTTLGLSREITPRVSLNSSGGVSLTRGGASDSTDVGFTGGLDTSVALRPDTSFSFGVAQAVDQDEFGDVQSRVSVRSSISHEINSSSGLSLNGRFSTANPLLASRSNEGDDRSVTGGVAYRLTLAERWNMNVGYNVRSDLENNDVSNLIFLQITRGLSFLE